MPYLEKITNYNVRDYMCCEKHCTNKSTHYAHHKYRGLDIILIFCDEHTKLVESSPP